MITRARTATTDLLDRVGRIRALIATVIVVAVIAVIGIVYGTSQSGQYRITARFVATPGLYVGNDVDILGVPTGTVESVTPSAGYVSVVISLPDHVKVPADAKAVLMAPNPVSDRFVELTPAWTPGMDKLAHGAVIARSNTVVPLELDQIYSSLDTLSKSLGPGGANAKGDLTAALHAFAKLADGNGADLHEAISTISAALPALTAHPEDLKNLITGLAAITSKLVARNDTIDSLYGDLATSSGQLADDRQSLSSAIANMQRAFEQVASFVAQNSKHISGGVANLNSVIASVLKEQQALIDTFDIAPLGFQNFNRAIDNSAPCASATGAPDNCTALWARLDVTRDAASFIKNYCGTSVLNSLLPIVAHNAGLADATATHTGCGAQIGLLQGRTGPPGSPPTPDLDLTHYLGRR